MFRAHSGRMVDGQITFDDPLSPEEFAGNVERSVERRDGSVRHLLRPPAMRRQPDAPPSRVTIEARSSVQADAVSQATFVLPDIHSSPNGIVIGMVLDGDVIRPIDLAAHTPAGGPFQKILAVTDAVETPIADRKYGWTGALWCDDAAAAIGGAPHTSIWFGMPPHFIPIVAVGVDGMTDGFFWDLPEAEPVDDRQLYRISPGSRFAPEAKRPFARSVTHEMLGAIESKRTDSAAITAIVSALGTAKSKPVDEKWPGEIKRSKPKGLGEGEAWLPVLNGDAVRVPKPTVAPDQPRYLDDPWSEFDAARAMLDRGYPGSALWIAYSALARFAKRQEALGIHFGYHAMIEPLERLGRDVIADRCRQILGETAPLMHDPPQPVQPAPTVVASPVWMVPFPTNRPDTGVTSTLEPGQTLDLQIDGAVQRIAIEQFVPPRFADLPATTVVSLLDTGAVAVSPDDALVSEHGKPTLVARSGDALVVVSVWEQPAVTGISLETVVRWVDEPRRLQPVRYVPFTPNGALGRADDEHLVKFGRVPPEIADAAWPFVVSTARFDASGGRLGSSAGDLDVLTTETMPQIHGIVVSERAAEILTGRDAATQPEVPIAFAGGTITRRYVNVPVLPEYDWGSCACVMTSDGDSSAVVRHLGVGAIEDAAQWRGSHDVVNDAWVEPHVGVLESAPRIMRQMMGPILVRLDVRDELIAAGVTGCDLGDRAPMLLHEMVET